MKAELLVGGQCGYWGWEHGGEDSQQCDQPGVRITVRDGHGGLMSIVRCIEHSDWIEAEEP